LNADETYYVSFDAYNLFSYCLDNPVSYIDATGGVATAIAISTYTITELSSALTMIVANLQVAVNAVKTAIVSSAFVVVAVAATVIAAVALKKIFDKIKYCMADADTVKKAVEKVKDKIQSYRNNTVYVIQEKNDNSKNAKVVYVGRTNNFERRKKEHQRSRFPEDKYDMYAVATGLTYNESRALEQTLISAYMLCYLSNCINSISVKKWSNFKHEFSNMKTLMEAAVDPE
jgi:predicted GIY-YIG superfamily endonuclease